MRILRSFILSLTLALAFATSAQKTEYIIKEVKGNVEYRLKQTDEWKLAKRLLAIPKSSIIKIADGGAMTIYSQSNPQTLTINTSGEHRLRTLIDEAEKKAAQARGGELAHVIKGHGEQGQTLRSGTSYRGPADMSDLIPITAAVKTASASASIGLTLTKDSEGDYGVGLSNDSDTPLVFAVIVNVAGKYSALRISDDPASTKTLLLPAGSSLTVPECTLADIDGMQAVAVAAKESFDPETLCIVLNSPATSEDNGGTDIGAVAVKASEK